MNVRLPPLPYAIGALEPQLSRRTLAEHYGTHHRSYVDRTRNLIEDTRCEYAPLHVVVRESAAREERGLFSAAAQAWNHAFYWSSMDPTGGGEADGLLAQFLDSSFGPQAAFRQQFVAAACDRSANGWVWLVLEGERLRILSTPKDDTALIRPVTPLLTIDLCEHAYHADYQERRADYINAYLQHLVNWKFATRNLAAGLRAQSRSALLWGNSVRAAASDSPVRGTSADIAASARSNSAAATRASTA